MVVVLCYKLLQIYDYFAFIILNDKKKYTEISTFKLIYNQGVFPLCKGTGIAIKA